MEKEFGNENVLELQKWEHLVEKIMDFENHIMFTLRCLKKDITQLSLKCMNTVGTSKILSIIKKAEMELMNEQIRTINNTIGVCGLERDMCITATSRDLDKVTFSE